MIPARQDHGRREASQVALSKRSVGSVSQKGMKQTVRKLGEIGLDCAPGAMVVYFEGDSWILAQVGLISSGTESWIERVILVQERCGAGRDERRGPRQI